MRKKVLTEAKHLLRSTFVGVIATHSESLKGYPFGSVTPYLCDSDGSVYFYMSDIAQHSKNLYADSRMSVTIFQQATQNDQNTQGRLTLVGDTEPVDDVCQEALLTRYVRLFPEAEGYKQTHDFKLWHIKIKRARYIGGFGKIFWLEKEEWLKQKPAWDANAETDMIEHMNQDHQDAISLLLKHHFEIHDDTPILSGILSEGCFIHSQQTNYWLPFRQTCHDTVDVRKALVEMTQFVRNQ